jgi:hypothetical protein
MTVGQTGRVPHSHIGRPEQLDDLRNKQQETEACGDNAEVIEAQQKGLGVRLGLPCASVPSRRLPIVYRCDSRTLHKLVNSYLVDIRMHGLS